MSTKREIIDSVFERLNSMSDDRDIPQEFVGHLIDTKRSMMIKQTYGGKKWNMPISTMQEICLGLELVDSVEGQTCLGTVLRSRESLPTGISFKGVEGAVLKVRTHDRKELQLNVIPIGRMPMVGSDPWTKNLIYAALDVDNRVYLCSGNPNHKMLEAIRVNGIYEKPDEAFQMGCSLSEKALANGSVNAIQSPAPTVCEPWDEPYPLEAALEPKLIDDIIKDLTRTIRLPEDNLNDAEDARR